MNERINELRNQTLAYMRDEWLRLENPTDEQWDDAYDKKFAELIVKECVKFVPSATQSNAIMKHFGVE